MLFRNLLNQSNGFTTFIVLNSLFMPVYAENPPATPSKTAPPPKTTPAVKAPSGIPTPPEVKNSLWFKYLEGAEKAKQDGDANLSKRYFLGSLSELEKDPAIKPRKDVFFLVRVSQLESDLMDLYKGGLDSTAGDESKEVAIRTEQVKTYRRMAELNKRLQPKNIFATKAQERYETADKELQKAKEALAAKEAAEKK